MRYYYIADKGEKKGPYSLEDLKNIEFNSKTLIWYEGLTDWVRAYQVSELAEFLATKVTPASISNIPNEKPPITNKENKTIRRILISLLIMILLVVAVIFAINKLNSKNHNGTNQANKIVAQTAIPLQPEMVNVQGGAFNMGDNSQCTPVHSVTVSSFSIAKYPTTAAQYRAFCTATNRPMPNPPSWGWNDMSPVVNVNYDDAVAYCNWLSNKYDETYRLPTEAEWEYAARGGNESQGYSYSGGNDLNEEGWYAHNSERESHPVGGKKPNEIGLYDMSGNVWEWCKDGYDCLYYNTSPTLNPQGPESVPNRVMRGGSWSDVAAYCRVTSRFGSPPGLHYDGLGFRVVSFTNPAQQHH